MRHSGKPSHRRIRVACSFCRKRKVRCDGGQPCGYCRHLAAEPCVYTEIKKNLASSPSSPSSSISSSSSIPPKTIRSSKKVVDMEPHLTIDIERALNFTPVFLYPPSHSSWQTFNDLTNNSDNDEAEEARKDWAPHADATLRLSMNWTHPTSFALHTRQWSSSDDDSSSGSSSCGSFDETLTSSRPTLDTTDLDSKPITPLWLDSFQWNQRELDEDKIAVAIPEEDTLPISQLPILCNDLGSQPLSALGLILEECNDTKITLANNTTIATVATKHDPHLITTPTVTLANLELSAPFKPRSRETTKHTVFSAAPQATTTTTAFSSRSNKVRIPTSHGTKGICLEPFKLSARLNDSNLFRRRAQRFIRRMRTNEIKTVESAHMRRQLSQLLQNHISTVPSPAPSPFALTS